MTDILIIGGGAAGAIAAARVRERGFSTLWVADSVGATGYSSGAIDDLLEEENEGTKTFLQLTTELNFKKTPQAVTQLGVIRPCSMVLDSQFIDWTQHTSESVFGVVEFLGLPAFCAESVCKMLHAQSTRAVPVTVALRSYKNHSWNNPVKFAKDFGHEEFRQECLEAITQAVAASGQNFSHLLFPAVLGLEPPAQFLQALETQIKCSASELLGASHSIPGLRVSKVLQKGCIKDKALSCERMSHQIVSVTLENAGVVHPKHVILATGTHLTNGYIFGLQPGFKVDEQQRPLDRFGEVFSMNLRAAGSIIHGPGLGKAIQSGYKAAELC